MSFRHQLCDLIVESNVPLPELPLCSAGAPECYFEVLAAAPLQPGDFRWIQHWYYQGKRGPWLSFGRDGNDYLYRFAAYGDFLISSDVRQVKCRPLPQAAEAGLRHVLIDHILPVIISCREPLVLHASAVLTPRGVLGFVGGSGEGKSTLALAFAQHGCALVTDDCLALRKGSDGWLAVPAYPGVRLWPEAAERVIADQSPAITGHEVKLRFSDPAVVPFVTTPVPVHRLYFLRSESEAGQTGPIIRELAASDAFMKLVHFALHLDPADREFLKRQFETVTQIRRDVPCFELSYRRDFAQIAVLRRTILRHASEQAVSSA